MAKITKQRQQEMDTARATLRALFPVGSTVSVVLRHVARSGMSRSISVLHPGDVSVDDVSWLVVKAGIGTFDRNHGGVKMDGCGMDMGFALVYELSYALYPKGFTVGDGGTVGRNGAKPGTVDTDGGYALRFRWV